MRANALAVPVPEGGALVKSDGPKLLHLGEQPHIGTARYHYPPETHHAALAQSQALLLASAGWEVKLFRIVNDTESNETWVFDGATIIGERNGEGVHVEIARWGDEGDGCCVNTRDPTRPMSLEVSFLPAPKPTRGP